MTLTGDFVTGQTVAFQKMRALTQTLALQEGVVNATDLLVVQRGAGANMSVDVGAGDAWVQVETGTKNGLSHVYNDATANVVVTSSNATNPRIDQILLRYNDASVPTGSGNIPTLEILTGTATGGATLDNRTGATALPNDCLRLADILVPALAASVTTANIRDRRPWARGAYSRIVDTGGNYSVTAVAPAALSTTRLRQRIECSGALLRVGLHCRTDVAAVAGQSIALSALVDGAQPAEFGSGGQIALIGPTTNANAMGIGASHVFDLVVAAGSHLVDVSSWVSSGTGSVWASTVIPFIFTIEELVRQNSNNGVA